MVAIESFLTSHQVALTFFVAGNIANGIFRTSLGIESCMSIFRGSTGPQPLRISQSAATAQFSVKWFSLFITMWKEFEACSQIWYLTGFWTLFYIKTPCFTWADNWLLTSSTLVSSLNDRSSHAISSGSANSSEATAFSSPISDRQLLFSCYERKRKRDKSEVYINNRQPNCLIYKFSVVLNAKITLHFIKLTR